MFRFNRLACALAVCMVVGVANGKAVKIKVVTPVLTGVTENADIDGIAVFNHDNGQGSGSTGMTHVAITLSDLLPNTEYKVNIRGGKGGGTNTFTTNPAGIGHVSTEFYNDQTTDFVGDPYDIHLFIFIDADGDYNPAPDEIRGVACISGNCGLPLSFTPCSADSECALPQHPCLDTSCVLNYCKAVWRECPTDNDVCTLDMCNPSDGVCEYTPIYDPDMGCNPF